MTVPAFSPANYLSALLRARLTIDNVRRAYFSPRWLSMDEIVTTHRLILVLQGRLTYQVNNTTIEIHPGQQIFVPAWTRRVWHGRSRQRVEFLWFAFSAGEADDSLHTLFWRSCKQLALEKAAIQRMIRLWPQDLPSTGLGSMPCPVSKMHQLQIEGEIKAVLARFWPEARPLNADGIVSYSSEGGIHPDLKIALGWMHEHYLEPEALQSLYGEIQLSPNHFRLLFRRAFGCSPQEHLHRLRFRRARHLVHDTELPFKQIAAEIGFSDPLFFSRQYHQFWGVSPRQDRQSNVGSGQ